MRIASACTQCRVSKRRCSSLQGQTKCYHCSRQKIPCSLTVESHVIDRPPAIVGHGVQSKTASLFGQLGEDKVHGMVELYLSLVHDRPHSLFHQPTLWAEINTKTIPPVLLLSLWAIGCRLSSDENLRSLAPSITSQARTEAQLETENICLTTVQAYVLIANIFAAELEPSLETLYFGMATRMAQILQLHRVDPQMNSVEQELRTRVWNSLIVADNFCSPGMGVRRQLVAHPGDEYQTLPADEVWFQGLSPGALAGSSKPPTPGLWAYNVKLVEVLGNILDLNRRLAEGMEDETAELNVHELAGKLNDWVQSLPSTMEQSEENLHRHRARGTGGSFVALHLGYHHYSTLLFFRYLDLGISSSQSSQSREYARKCRHHASSFSQLLKKSQESPGSEAVYATVGHMAVVSSSVLLHILLFGESTEVQRARNDFMSNFVALLELKKCWPCLEHTMGRLLLFQDVCLRDQHANTHRMDSWMVRFLIEHSLKLDERSDPSLLKMRRAATDTSASDITGFDARERMANKALSTLWQSVDDELQANNITPHLIRQ